MYKKIAIFLLVSSVLFGCKKEKSPEPTYQTLVNYRYLQELGSLEMAFALSAIGADLGNVASLIRNNIDIYRINYRTRFKNQTITASGLVCVPKGLNNLPIVSAQHGTIFIDSTAPSYFSFIFPQPPRSMTGFEVLASMGYITVLPDYIGYGESSNILHPYYLEEYSATACIDMLKAAFELLNEKGIIFNRKLFLLGYSQGGYVTLAMQKKLQNNPSELGVPITATAAGAGGYNINRVMENIFKDSIYTSPNFLGYVLHSYNTTLNWNRALNTMFQSPFDARIPILYNGNYSNGFINSALDTNLNRLFVPSFFQQLKDSTDSQVINAFADNSVHDYIPETPLRLYHATTDEVIPVATSREVFQVMNSGGGNVEYIEIPGDYTHATAVIPMMINVILWFEGLK